MFSKDSACASLLKIQNKKKLLWKFLCKENGEVCPAKCIYMYLQAMHEDTKDKKKSLNKDMSAQNWRNEEMWDRLCFLRNFA